MSLLSEWIKTSLKLFSSKRQMLLSTWNTEKHKTFFTLGLPNDASLLHGHRWFRLPLWHQFVSRKWGTRLMPCITEGCAECRWLSWLCPLLPKVGQPWIVAEHNSHPRYYCQGPVVKSILVKKVQNEGCSKFVFTKQTRCPGTTDKRIYSFTLVITADERGKGVKCQQELSIFG